MTVQVSPWQKQGKWHGAGGGGIELAPQPCPMVASSVAHMHNLWSSAQALVHSRVQLMNTWHTSGGAAGRARPTGPVDTSLALGWAITYDTLAVLSHLTVSAGTMMQQELGSSPCAVLWTITSLCIQ